MKLYIDNWRWQGVPFYIRTGKMMPTKVTEIVVHFKPTPHKMFTDSDGLAVPNQLIIRIQPDEGIALKFAAKVPGSGFEVKRVSMDFTYDQLGGIVRNDTGITATVQHDRGRSCGVCGALRHPVAAIRHHAAIRYRLAA